MTPSGIEPATFRLVAQYLKEMRHRVDLIHILHNIFLPKVCSHNSSDCVNAHVSHSYIKTGLTRALYILKFIS